MTHTPQISIIIAVYNAEVYLHRCIDSILSQTFTDFEVLLIDDGSKDHSGQLCDTYAEQDKRFIVFHRTNHGVGSTRHFGIDHARGTYTIHIDSDDWIEPNFLNDLYHTAIEQQADVVICDYVEEYESKSLRKRQKPSKNTHQEVLQDILACNLHGSCWNKLIRRECYTAHGINFEEGLNWGEDTTTVVRILQHPVTIAYCDSAIYHYDCYSNPNSYTRFTPLPIFLQREKSVRLLMEIVRERPLIDYVYSRLLTVAYLALKIDAYSPKEYQHQYGLLKHEPIFHYQNHFLQEKLFVWTALHISYRIAHWGMWLKLHIHQWFHHKS